MGDDPPYLAVGTEVSAKYKGAFCEAKIRKVVRIVKCKVTFKSGQGSFQLSDDQVKGTLRTGATVEAKHPDKNQFLDAIINKIQDCSQYTVVFDDGDITTLRRSALCLKSGRHFNESETLDQLPLTHPEHFSNPVVGGRRGVRRRNLNADNDKDDSSEDEDVPAKKGRKKNDREADMGKVVCVESTDKKKSKDPWFPALIVSPSAQEAVKISIKADYLVRSFRDGRYYTVPKKETKDFKESGDKYESNSAYLRSAVEKATNYLEKNELPPHWDRDILFGSGGNVANEESNNSDEQQSDSDSSEDDPTEDKDRFVAQLYKFMDDRGTPINKVPLVCNKDLDLYKLYKIVKTHGGYNKVTNGSQWKAVTIKMGYGAMPSTSTINLVKQSYKKCVYHYEEMNRKLGCTMNARAAPTTKSRSSRQFFREKHASGSTKDMKKEEPEEPPKKEEKEEKKPIAIVEVEPEPAISDSETKKSEQLDESRRSRSRAESRSRTKEPEEVPEKPKTPIKKKRASLKEKEKEPVKEEPPSPSVIPKKVGRGKKKETEEETEKSEPEEVLDHIPNNVHVDVGHKLLVYYGPQADGKVTYQAKVLKTNMKTKSFLVHYTGWNTRYDEWIKRGRISENLTFKPDQGKPAQGRGPAGYAETTESESSSSTKASTKSPKRKPRAIPSTPTAATRSKSGITRRKRFSGDTDLIKRRKTRQKSDQGPAVPIPSVSGSDAESSDSEDKAVPVVSTPPSSVSSASSTNLSKTGNLEKRNEDDDASSSSTSSSISKLTKDGEKDKQNQVIDLNQIRSEMKGLDKMVKSASTPTPPAAATPPPNVSELKVDVDIYDFQEDANDAPKLKMFAPRSPDKKDDVVIKSENAVSPDIVAKREVPKETLSSEASTSTTPKTMPVTQEIKSESSSESDKETIDAPVASDIPLSKDTDVSNQTTELQVNVEGRRPATPSKGKGSQSSHILKVATPRDKSKSPLVVPGSPVASRQRSPVSPSVAHPPPPPLVRSSTVIVASKAMVAPTLAQVRPPMLIQRPAGSLVPGSPIRLAVAGAQDVIIRPPVAGKLELAMPAMKPDAKVPLFAAKQLFRPVTPIPGSIRIIASQSSIVNPVTEAKETALSKTPTVVPTVATPSDTKLTSTTTTSKVGSVGKEKKLVVATELIRSSKFVKASSSPSAKTTPAASSIQKKKNKKIISKRFVESESDSSTEAQAETPKKVAKKRQGSETPKKSVKKPKLEETKPVIVTKRPLKGRPPNKKSPAPVGNASEVVKPLSVATDIVGENSRETATPEKIDERIQEQLSPDIIERVEKTPKKQEKYFGEGSFERFERRNEKLAENLEKDLASKSKVADKKDKNAENDDKDSAAKHSKLVDKKDQIVEDVEMRMSPKPSKPAAAPSAPPSVEEAIPKEVEKVFDIESIKITDKKEVFVEKGVDKKDKAMEKTAERKEKLIEKAVDKKEKNVDKLTEKKEKISEKFTDKKDKKDKITEKFTDKNVEKVLEKKDKSAEKHFDKKEKVGEKSFEKKGKPQQKLEKSMEKKDKNVEKKHTDKKDKKIEKLLDKKEKTPEGNKKSDKKDKTEKNLEKKEKQFEKDLSSEKSDGVPENVTKEAAYDYKTIENLEKMLKKSSKDVLPEKPVETAVKQGKKFDKASKSSPEKPFKTAKATKSEMKLARHSEKLVKSIEMELPDKSPKPSDKQGMDSEKHVKQLEKREKLPKKLTSMGKKNLKSERESSTPDKAIPEQISFVSLDLKNIVGESAIGQPSNDMLPVKEEVDKMELPVKEESTKQDFTLTNPCSVDLSGSVKSFEKSAMLPTISVTIPSKVMSLNLVELSDKKLDSSSSPMFFASKAVDINAAKVDESPIPYSSPITSPTSVEKEAPMSLVSDEVIAKSPEPENVDEENLRLKSLEKQETHVQDDMPCGLLLCEEIIPGSPAGEDTSRYSFDDEAKEEKGSKSSGTKAIDACSSKPGDSILTENVTKTRYIDIKIEEADRVEGLSAHEKASRSLMLEKEDANKSSADEQRNNFNTQQDTPQSMETTPPMTPEISSGSSISSGSPRIDVGRGSPRAGRGSSKSKESSDGEEDLSEFPKHSDHADGNYLSNEMGGSNIKDSLPSMSTSGTRKPRLSEPRGSRNVSPLAKRRRLIRRKSPEEVVRPYPYRGRSSTGRRSQAGMSSDNQDQHKTMPPPPPINLGRPPRSSRFNFIPELDDSMDSEQRIGLIQQAIQDLREKYMSVKSEMVSFERRRKRWKRREREKAVAERTARQEANRLNS